MSYRQQLSEWNTPSEFYYTNNTRSQPVQPAKLRHVAGVGSSGVVQYGGSGAYFLDQISPGVWRLEVMPDAVPLHDPFETASPYKVVTQIAWNEQPLTVNLPDLGPGFQLRALNGNNHATGQASAGQLRIKPGTYLLTKSVSPQWPTLPEGLGTLGLAEFVAPAPYLLRAQVQHEPAQQAAAGQPLTITATVAGIAATDSVWLVARHYYGPTRTLPMQRTGLGTVVATVPAALTYPGVLRYWVVVRKYGLHTFPTGPNAGKSDDLTEGGQPGSPRDWYFVDDAHWEVPLVPATAPAAAFPGRRGPGPRRGAGPAPAGVDRLPHHAGRRARAAAGSSAA